MSEAVAEVKRNPLVEKIGEKKLRAVAALGIAAASFLGISGKLNTGVGAGIETLDPNTGKSVTVGVMASSTEDIYPRGLPHISGKQYGDIQAWQVNLGGAKLTVYAAPLEQKAGKFITTMIGVYPGFEAGLGK
jgi:hypothetical protein